jgi:hypothetical protein
VLTSVIIANTNTGPTTYDPGTGPLPVTDPSGAPLVGGELVAGATAVLTASGALGGSFVPTDEIAFAASECAFGDAAHKRLRCANGSGKLTFSPTRAALYHRVGVSGRGREFALPTVASDIQKDAWRINAALGRRFRIISSRYLKADEI